MNSKQINDAFDLAERRARVRGLTDPAAITTAIMDDPAMAPVLADPAVQDLMRKYFERLCRETVEELAEAEGWKLT